MKNLTLIAALASSLAMVACVKTETKKTKIDLPEIKKYEPITIKKNGLKCDMVGESENKEIFMKLETKEGKTTASFHDFTSASKISLTGAHFADYSLLSFSMTENPEDSQVLVGESVLLHADTSQLSDEGKVLSVTGRLTINKDKSGKLEQKFLLSMDDKTIKNTDFQEIAKIENCEEFEANWM